jgi:hypothetical protein
MFQPTPSGACWRSGDRHRHTCAHIPSDLSVRKKDDDSAVAHPVYPTFMSDDAFERGPISTPSEPAYERNERIFQSLPPLSSQEYLDLVRTAPAKDLPAEVLVRAFQALGCAGRAAEATLGRLLTQNEMYGYLKPLWLMAERRVTARDWFDAAYLFDETISVIWKALAGPQGKNAHAAWLKFLKQRLEDAYRNLNGRRNERQNPVRSEPTFDADTGVELDPLVSEAALDAPWQGRVGPDVVEWLESFMRRSMARIRHTEIREVGLDQISADPSALSGSGTPGRPSLAIRYGVDRFQVMRWRKIAFARLLADLENQDEWQIDVTWLREALRAKERPRKRP